MEIHHKLPNTLIKKVPEVSRQVSEGVPWLQRSVLKIPNMNRISIDRKNYPLEPRILKVRYAASVVSYGFNQGLIRI